MVTTIRYPSLN